MNKTRAGIRKTVTGGRIKETFEIEETSQGKRMASRKILDKEDKDRRKK